MRIRDLLLVSAALGALSVASPALAQSETAAGSADADSASPAEGASDSGATGDIIVTARRRAEDVSKVPVAITAFGAAQIEQRGIESVQDLYKLSPGLNVNGAGTRGNPVVTIRGQTRGVTGLAAPGVIVYFNEVPLANQGSLIQTFDMDNIQVLKGPQGTLFGRNSIGGAVLTYSKTASHTFNGYAEVELGNFGFHQFEGAINVPVIQDVLAVRFPAHWDPKLRIPRGQVVAAASIVSPKY